MKKLLLSLGACLAIVTASFSQTTIYQETFETGNSFTMNSTDLGGTTTFNTWLMNNTYSGGSGTVICLGFPFSFTVSNTPSQPVGITNSPSSNYMHISAQAAISSGITCASYIPSDGGTCVSDETNFAKMTAPISTVGFTSVMFDFWWMCAGSVDAYGEIYYSLDGGSTWVLKQSNLNNVTNWTQTAISDVAWDNQSSIMFAFRFVNNTAATAADPSLSIDEIIVTGVSVANSITTSTNLVPSSWCQGSTIPMQVDFTSTGTFNAGNIYSAELSDAAGSFSAPTVIGTLASTANSGMILGVISGATPAGTGYRIRVVSDNPVTIGTDNGVDLIISAPPTVALSVLADACETDPFYLLTGGSPAGGTYTGPGITGGVFDPAIAGVGTHNVTYFFTDGNGCSGQASGSITVHPTPSVSFALLSDVCDYTPTFTLSGGTPIGGIYSGVGVSGLVFDPSVAGLGPHLLTYTDTDMITGCVGMEDQTITVDACVSVDEKGFENLVLYPNPVSESFQLISDYEIESVQVLDMSGRTVKTFGAAQLTYDISSIPSGVYMVTVHSANHIGQLRIVVE